MCIFYKEKSSLKYISDQFFFPIVVYFIGKYCLIISKLRNIWLFWVYNISIDSIVTASKAEMMDLTRKEGFWNKLLWSVKQGNKI